MLVQLLYLSRHNGIMENLPEFVGRLKGKNKKRGISSILLSTNDCYLHLLEGNRQDINALYNRIANDTRHYNCVILRYIDIKSREFSEWSAEHMSINEFSIGDINLLIPDDDFDPETISSSKAVTIIRRIHAHLQVKHSNPE